jgi:glycosyltransferase involved in cell wall biosynthesis
VAEGETGLLFQAGDSATLARQIARILADDDLAVRLSNRAREVAHLRYSPSQIVEDQLKAYDDILNSAKQIKQCIESVSRK